MSNEIETRYLIVTLPNTSGEEADSVAELIDGELTDGFTVSGRVDHALGLVLRDGVHCLAEDGEVTLTDLDLDQTAGYTPAEARALAGALLRAAGEAETVRATCEHCERDITLADDRWIDPAAYGDDIMWRETCEGHDTFTAEHEPAA